MALLNLGSSDPNLRLSSYRLLYALTRAFNFDVDKQLLDAKGKIRDMQYCPLFLNFSLDLCLPANSTDFIVNISERIAAKEPLLTLEFLNECVMGYTKSEEATKYLVLLYMMPWLSNLSYYCGNSATNTVKIKEILRQLVDLTINGEVTTIKLAQTITCISHIFFIYIYR